MTRDHQVVVTAKLIWPHTGRAQIVTGIFTEEQSVRELREWAIKLAGDRLAQLDGKLHLQHSWATCEVRV